MADIVYKWESPDANHEARFVYVPGTAGRPYQFGFKQRYQEVHLPSFHIGATTVTQAMWEHVMGENPSIRRDPRAPVENVSWLDITCPGGFIDRLNTGPLAAVLPDPLMTFRLPSETEWEYAARGGPEWTDDFLYSGSHRLEDVGWYGRRWSLGFRLLTQWLGFERTWRLVGRFNRWRLIPTRTHAVGAKAPNQLGLYDMSGNVWEWCGDAGLYDTKVVPADGTPCHGEGGSRVVRGGCHHNWDFHCTVSWRYSVPRDSRDGCIGLRLVIGLPRATEAGSAAA